MSNIRQIRDLLAMLVSIADVHRTIGVRWLSQDAQLSAQTACALEARCILGILARTADDERIAGVGEQALPYHYLTDYVARNEHERRAIAMLACGHATALELIPFRM
jgi:hypothetical protein